MAADPPHGDVAPVVERLTGSPAERLDALIAESEQLGVRFVRRLADEWTSGANRFDQPGETLFVASIAGRPAGVCGLNVDPYTTAPDVGRVRHLYVLSADRRQGVGRRLVTEVIAAARAQFDTLRLSTRNPAAARLYEQMGFRRTDGPDCTHVMALRSVVVLPYQPRWAAEFTRIATRVREAVGPAALRIDHIGSTAVSGLGAKDVIDVQVTVASLDRAAGVTGPLRTAGFRHGVTFDYDVFPAIPAGNPELRKLFMREPAGERRTHLHVREQGRFNQRYALVFRDYLRASPDARAGYEREKRRAAERCPDDIDGYLALKEPALHAIYDAADAWAGTTGWAPDDRAV